MSFFAPSYTSQGRLSEEPFVDVIIRSITPNEVIEAGGVNVIMVCKGAEAVQAAGQITVDGNVVTINTWSDTSINFVMPAGSAGSVDVVLLNDSSGTDTFVDAVTYFADIGDPFLTKMEAKMAELIEGLIAGEYHYNWGTSNVFDRAKMVFPTAVIYLENEESLDEEGGAWGQAYFNSVIFRIEVTLQLEAEDENPVFRINQEYNKALDDLKKIFGIEWNLQGTTDTIMYKGSERVEEKHGDIMIPGKLITRWKCRYEQQRESPELGAC